MGKFGDFLKEAGNSALASVTGGLSSGISGAVSGIFGNIGYGRRLKKQVEAQKELNEQAAQLNYEYGKKAHRTHTNECSTCTSEATATTVWRQCEGRQSRRDYPSDCYTVAAVWLAEEPEALAEAFRATPECP